MSPDLEHRIEQIFSAARDLPPQDRVAFLQGACQGDSELRRGVDSLLEADEQAGLFLQPLTGVSTAHGPAIMPPSARVLCQRTQTSGA